MAMSVKEFLNKDPLPQELCGCGCGKPLEKNDSCGPQYMVIKHKKVFVNPDCYFDAFSEEIDKRPIGGPGIRGPKNK